MSGSSLEKRSSSTACLSAANPQERLVIIGQSGMGKTTILRLLLGILAPTRGSVFFKGREISKMTADELQQIRNRIGMVYQDAALLSSSSVPRTWPCRSRN